MWYGVYRKGAFGYLANTVETPTEGARVDLRDKVTGRAEYVEDRPEFPGMCYAAALRSPHSHARIVSLDSSRATRLPGVLAVLDRDHLKEFDLHVERTPGRVQPVITTDKARFDGDLLALVAAVDLRTARQAAGLIDVTYELLPAVFTVTEALAPGAPLVHEELGTNLVISDGLEWGDVEQGFREADSVFEKTFFCPSVFHHPMEPSVSFVTTWGANDTVETWAPVNSPWELASKISEFFGLRRDQVRVRVPYIGGGFGAKSWAPAMMAALALSRKMGRPVKLIATAGESFRVAGRSTVDFKAKIGVRQDGTLVALDVELWIDTGAYLTPGTRAISRNATNSAWGCYRIPHFRVQTRTSVTNKVPAYFFRNTGKNETTFAIESAVDSIARRMGIDPIEFRAKNMLRRGEFVTDKWRVRGVEAAADVRPLDTDLFELMRKALEGLRWGQEPRSHSQISSRPRCVRGKGLALTLRWGASPYGNAYAMVTLDRDGVVRVCHNAPELGGGAYTVMSIIASRTLGIPQSQIEVGIPDTGNNLQFVGVNSQRTTVQMGTAVREACEELKRELVTAAVQTKGGKFAEWQLSEGQLRWGETCFSIKNIVQSFPGELPLKGVGACSFTPPADRAYNQFAHWAPGAAAAEVEIDLDTGEVHLIGYAAVADAGKTLHYRSAKGQVEGGAIMGLGAALFEELHYEEGQLQNGDPFQYRLPLICDVPERFQTAIVENEDGPGPFGAKGMAQTSIACAAPAVGNAIYDAIGVQIKSIPFTSEKILHALGKLKHG